MKKYISGIMAIIFAASLVAFTRPKSNMLKDQVVWTYIGPAAQQQPDLDNPEYYDTSTPSCGGSTKICTIMAPDDGSGLPIIDVQANGHVTKNNQFYSPTLKD